MVLRYAERWDIDENGRSYIAERGVFLSVAEFVPYRRLGWEGCKDFNQAADELIRSEDATPQETSR